jgi:hypothetical protein
VLLFDLSFGHLCVADELLFEWVDDGVFVAAMAWVSPSPPTSALAPIETAIAERLTFIFMSWVTSLRVVASRSSSERALLVVS